MPPQDATKRIPKSLGTETTLFGTYSLTDAAVALFPGVLVILCVQVLLPPSLSVGGVDVQTLTLPVAGSAIGVGALFVYLTPAYTSSMNWIITWMGFYHGANDYDVEAAKDHTHLERIHADRNALERTDGAFVGIVQVTPPTMALATDTEWAEKVDAYGDFLDTTVEFPIQIFSTTQEFPVEEYLGHYESRLSDPDVQANPHLAQLIDSYLTWYRQDIDSRQMTIRDHYVVVPVRPREVQFDNESLLQQLAGLPLLGSILSIWFAPRIAEEQAAMFDELDERVRKVEAGLREIDGCTTSRIDANESVSLLDDFWTGDGQPADMMGKLARRTPVVRGARE
jgi:hypothetical protein